VRRCGDSARYKCGCAEIECTQEHGRAQLDEGVHGVAVWVSGVRVRGGDGRRGDGRWEEIEMRRRKRDEMRRASRLERSVQRAA
jgi:hypothetical protein